MRFILSLFFFFLAIIELVASSPVTNCGRDISSVCKIQRREATPIASPEPRSSKNAAVKPVTAPKPAVSAKPKQVKNKSIEQTKKKTASKAKAPAKETGSKVKTPPARAATKDKNLPKKSNQGSRNKPAVPAKHESLKTRVKNRLKKRQ
jgi:hypothetical protein